jgi:hypothetical protein
MRSLTISILITLFSVSGLQAQTPPTPPARPAAPAAPAAAPAKPALNPVLLGQTWVDRLNDLDDWHLSMEGKEVGVDEVVDGFMALLAPDVLVEVPPYDEEQIGPVMLIGTKQVRQWVTKFARTEVNLNYTLKRQTERQAEGELMVYSKQLPWGGLGISFPIIADYAMRQDRRRFMEVGAVFIQAREDGKIDRFRLFLSEKEQVVGGRGF